MTLLRNFTAFATLVAALGLSSPAFAASASPPADEQIVHNLLDALSDDDYDRFMGYLTPEFGGVTGREFMFIAGQLGPRLQQGYELEYFGMLEQLGYDISVWKISFSDKHDDVLATLNVQDGKVAGFMMQ